MVLDLENLTKSQQTEIKRITTSVIQDYNDITDTIISSNNKFEFLVCNVTSRNVFFSDILNSLAILKYIKIHFDEIDTIICYDKYFYLTISDVFSRKIVLKRRCLSSWLFLKRYVYILFWCIAAFFSRSRKRRKKLLETPDLTIIDTFLEEKCVNRKCYSQVYYGDLLKYVDKTDNIYYLMNYLPIPSSKTSQEIYDNSDVNVAYIFDFLKFRDYIFALLAPFKMKTIDVNGYEYLGFPLKYIFKKASWGNFQQYFILPFLYYKFWNRLKEYGANLKLIIDWFENQSYDKALYYSLNQFYPEVPVKAYVGFIGDPRVTPHIIPSEIERKNHIAPTNLYVVGQAMKAIYSQFDTSGIYHLAPYFRSNKVWKIKKKKSNLRVTNVLIPLTMVNEEIAHKLRIVKLLDADIVNSNIKLFVKPHPSSNVEDIVNELSGVSNKVNIAFDDIYGCLKFTDIIIAAQSTTIIEALALGIPVINIKDDSAFEAYKPYFVSDNLWKDVSNISDIHNVINELMNVNYIDYMHDGEVVKNGYFERVCKESVLNFMSYSYE